MRQAVCAALVAGLAGCGDRAAPASVPPPADAVAQVPRQLRRLSNHELNAVASSLVGRPLELADGLMREPRVEGWDNDATALVVTEAKLDDFAAVAELVAGQVSTLPGCTDAACAGGFAADFAQQAWGRPLTGEERTRLEGVYRAGQDHSTGVRLMVEAMLLSPHFVYRSELGAPNPDGLRRLTAYETASAMSFLLTGNRPDAELRAAAAKGLLEVPAERVKQAKRLMDTDAGRRKVRDLLLSWLDLHALEQVNRAAALTYFTWPVRHALQTELERYIDDAAFGPVGTLQGLFGSTKAFPGAETAGIYGDDLLGPIGQYDPVDMKPDRRRGIVSLGGFLAHHAALDHTAPVQRGLFIRSRLFCDEIAAPPPNALNSPPNPNDTSKTNRQKYALHSQAPACVGCHRLMDPIGFGLENFDATGRHQATDNGFPVDAQGTLTGTDVDGPFTGPAELASKLAVSAQVRRCFAQNVWRGAMGRFVAVPSTFEVKADAKMVDVVLAVIANDGFVRRVPGEGEAP